MHSMRMAPSPIRRAGAVEYRSAESESLCSGDCRPIFFHGAVADADLLMRTIPADFPQNPHPATLAGVQPKLAARKIDGQYVTGLTDEELAQRYDVCRDLVSQLVAYCQRKSQEHPDWTEEQVFQRMRKGLVSKQAAWDLSALEVDWILRHVAAALDWQLSV